MKPLIAEYDGIHVVRDDLFPGGTKARFVGKLFDDADEVVYASPQEGGAQVALATVARHLGKRATIFVAKRAQKHARVSRAHALGAKIVEVEPGYLNVVKAKARNYCQETGAKFAPFGMDFPEAIDAIAEAALSTGLTPDEVWCASGSGVLMRGLSKAWPNARRHSVQVGKGVTSDDVAGAEIHVHPLDFTKACQSKPPFPSDPHYDAKGWEMAKAHRGAGLVLFWNVLG